MGAPPPDEVPPKPETEPPTLPPQNPAEVEPAEVKPAEVKPAEVKPAEVKSAEVVDQIQLAASALLELPWMTNFKQRQSKYEEDVVRRLDQIVNALTKQPSWVIHKQTVMATGT